MHWNKGEKQDAANVGKSLALGIRLAIKQARGKELTPEDERKLRRQVKRNRES